MNRNKQGEQHPHENLIKENIRRAFAEKADEALPADLLALLERLRAQDGSDDKN